MNIQRSFEARTVLTNKALGFLFDFAGDLAEDIGLGGDDVADPPVNSQVTMYDPDTAPTPDAIDMSGATSFGVFLDDETGDTRSVVFRLEFPQFTIFGFSLTPGLKIHVQYLKGAELERRRWALLRRGSVVNCPNTVQNCGTWKPYRNYVSPYIGDDGSTTSSTWEICESILLDSNHKNYLDRYNRIMVATHKENGLELPERIKDPQDQWYLPAKYDMQTNMDEDIVVFYIGIEEWDAGLVRMDDLSLVVIANNGFNEIYIDVQLDVTVLFVAGLKVGASIQNNPGGLGNDQWRRYG